MLRKGKLPAYCLYSCKIVGRKILEWEAIKAMASVAVQGYCKTDILHTSIFAFFVLAKTGATTKSMGT